VQFLLSHVSKRDSPTESVDDRTTFASAISLCSQKATSPVIAAGQPHSLRAAEVAHTA